VAGADGYLHLRRMALAARGPGLLPPREDRWMHVPEGVSLPWPPLFDAAGGLLARAAGGGPQDLDTTAWAGFTLVGALALLSVLLALAVGSRLGGLAGGALAGLTVASSPAHLNASVLGRIDHHVLEALVPVLVFELARWRRPDGLPRSAAWRAVALAAVVAFAAGALPSAAVPLGLGAGAVALWLVAPTPNAKARRARRRDFRAVVGGLALGAAGLTPLALSWGPPGGPSGPGSAFSLGLFQPSLLAALALALTAVEGATTSPHLTRLPAGWRAALSLAAGSAVGLGALLLLPGGRDAIASGSGFVGRTAGFTALISESRPLLSRGLAFAAVFATPLAFAAPLLAALLARRARRAGRLRSDARATSTLVDGAQAAWIYGLLTLITLALALAQTRFAVLTVLPLALTASASVGVPPQAPPRRRRVSWALTALAVASLTPGALLAARARVVSPRRLAVRDALTWLRARAAPAGDAWRPETIPAYGVLAPWSFGHDLLTVGTRANVASPYLLPGHTQGLQAALRFELATDPARARALLAAHRVRYVLSAPPSLDGLRRYARALGRDPDAYVRAPPGEAPHLTPLGRRTMHRRLADTGGAELPPSDGDAATPGLGFLALRYVAPGGGAKVYEVVPGAQLRVRGLAPGARAAVQVDLAGIFGRWRWATSARADDRGEAALRVPYCTDPPAPPTDEPTRGASPPAKEPPAVRVLKVWLRGAGGEARRPLRVPCEAVRTGAAVEVSDAARAPTPPAP